MFRSFFHNFAYFETVNTFIFQKDSLTQVDNTVEKICDKIEGQKKREKGLKFVLSLNKRCFTRLKGVLKETFVVE